MLATLTILFSTFVAGNQVIDKAPRVGGWGGTCTCPDGKVYQVGDKYNYCRSLACEGGISGTCNRKTGPWSKRKVVCAPPSWDDPTAMTCERCAAHAFSKGTTTQEACFGCDCGDGVAICGCAHCTNKPKAFPPAWDDPTKSNCERCASFAFHKKTTTQDACYNCDCGDGVRICGCAHCHKNPPKCIHPPAWDDPTKSNCERCASFAFHKKTTTQNACYNCDCGDGVRICGCAHCHKNPPKNIHPPAWDDPTKSNCERCASFAFYKKTSTQGACYNCDCGDGVSICGCAHCHENPPKDIHAPAWDNPSKSTCERCASHAFHYHMTTRGSCYGCNCEDGTKLCGCAHCPNEPKAIDSAGRRVESDMQSEAIEAPVEAPVEN